MILICDICTKEFEITKDNILTKDVAGIEVKYFLCEHCGFRYITSCIDSYMVKEQRRLKKLDIQIASSKSNDNKQELILKSQKLLKHLKTHHERLKEQVLKELDWWI